jgi:hypothetical protein
MSSRGESVARKFKWRPQKALKVLGKVARFLIVSRLLGAFVVLCTLGVMVGIQTRPDPKLVPYGDLFDHMRVVSYRESPADSAVRFMVELSDGSDVFRRYDVDGQAFLPPVRDRDYNRAITSTSYRPLQVRGHVAQGLWLDLPRRPGPDLLPEQFQELYRATLDFVKPVSLVAGALGTVSGYSVGYRLGIWNHSLRSHAVQERVLATPDLGRTIAREAWRRVLLEPAVMAGEDDVTRFATIGATQRVYANFFRIALDDSDGFIPREAQRLTRLGHQDEARAMLDFAAAVRHATPDTAQVTSANFSAVERWASLLVRRGHWAADAIPPAGEERARYLGMLAWYGVAPLAPGTERVWIGPRLLVREGDTEGFVTDAIPATGVGCPIGWRARLKEETIGPIAQASAWFSDHPEFLALATVLDKVAVVAVEQGGRMIETGRELLAERTNARIAPAVRDSRSRSGATLPASFKHRVTVTSTAAPHDSVGPRSVSLEFISEDGHASPCARLRLAAGQYVASAGASEKFVMGGGGGSLPPPDANRAPEGEALVSVTVVAPSSAAADSASLALLSLGTAGAKSAARDRPDLAVILVERGIDGVETVWVESDLEGRFALENCGAPLWVEYY